MSPNGWQTPEQKAFIHDWRPFFDAKQASKQLETDFWPKMCTAFFDEFPMEIALHLPIQKLDEDPHAVPQRPLTKAERDVLGAAIQARTKQLHHVFNNYHQGKKRGASGNARSLAASLFRAIPKRKRRHQVLEVFQIEFKEEITSRLATTTDYCALNEAARCRDEEGQWVDDADDDARTKRINQACRERQAIRRRVVEEMWEELEEEEKERIRYKAKNEVVAPAPTAVVADEDGNFPERTPEEYQMSIDESLSVAEVFCAEFGRMTGFVGTLVYAGPVPNQSGALGLKSCSFGVTPNGLDFQHYHDNWKKGVTNPLCQFARKAIPRQTRIARSILTPQKDDEDADTPPEKSGKSKDKTKAKPKTARVTVKPPRRPRGNTRVPAALPPAPTTAPAAPQPTTAPAAPHQSPVLSRAPTPDLTLTPVEAPTPSYQDYENSTLQADDIANNDVLNVSYWDKTAYSLDGSGLHLPECADDDDMFPPGIDSIALSLGLADVPLISAPFPSQNHSDYVGSFGDAYTAAAKTWQRDDPFFGGGYSGSGMGTTGASMYRFGSPSSSSSGMGTSASFTMDLGMGGIGGASLFGLGSGMESSSSSALAKSAPERPMPRPLWNASGTPALPMGGINTPPTVSSGSGASINAPSAAKRKLTTQNTASIPTTSFALRRRTSIPHAPILVARAKLVPRPPTSYTPSRDTHNRDTHNRRGRGHTGSCSTHRTCTCTCTCTYTCTCTRTCTRTRSGSRAAPAQPPTRPSTSSPAPAPISTARAIAKPAPRLPPVAPAS
ncbi:hypothetical protein C8R46DRAFT_1232098 [Mycena filopes]|nr:hypothetical protein C8R46DRAFT_1232098 [Mycena filopes]